jgi:glyoxylate reductase
VISNFGVGVDHINLKDATERNILVGYTPNCLNDTVADMAIGLALSFARNIVSGHLYATNENTTTFDPNW